MVFASAPVITRRSLPGLPSTACYWIPDLLSSFTFLMSGHATPINASMMLGDTAYARDQLRLACTFDDRGLQQVAVEMLSTLGHRPHAYLAASGA